MPRKSGRSTYSEKIAERILDALCEGASAACDVPRQTVRSWLDRIPACGSAFEAAKLVRVEALADQINILADSAQRVATDALKAGENPNAAIAALRVQCETKRWLLAKLAPATYGDRNQVELTSASGRDLIPPPETVSNDKLALAALTHILTVLNGGGAEKRMQSQPELRAAALLGPRADLGPEPVQSVPVRVAEPELSPALLRSDAATSRSSTGTAMTNDRIEQHVRHAMRHPNVAFTFEGLPRSITATIPHSCANCL